MLNPGIRKSCLIFLILIFSCERNEKIVDDDEKYFNCSIEILTKTNYYDLFSKIKDSLGVWVKNGSAIYEAERTYNYDLDSLLCINRMANRFIGCIHIFGNQNGSTADDLRWLYGEKIDDKWYFFTGASVVVPREMIKGQDIHKPLTYQQLHEIALKEIYGGYLDKNGNINEEWFTSHFEGPGWGDFNKQEADDWLLKGKRFTNKKDYFEWAHLTVVRNNWNFTKKDSVGINP